MSAFDSGDNEAWKGESESPEEGEESFEYDPIHLDIARLSAVVYGRAVPTELRRLFDQGEQELLPQFRSDVSSAITRPILDEMGFLRTYVREPGNHLYVARFVVCENDGMYARLMKELPGEFRGARLLHVPVRDKSQCQQVDIDQGLEYFLMTAETPNEAGEIVFYGGHRERIQLPLKGKFMRSRKMIEYDAQVKDMIENPTDGKIRKIDELQQELQYLDEKAGREKKTEE